MFLFSASEREDFGQSRFYPKGTVIAFQGDTITEAFIVANGKVEQWFDPSKLYSGEKDSLSELSSAPNLEQMSAKQSLPPPSPANLQSGPTFQAWTRPPIGPNRSLGSSHHPTPSSFFQGFLFQGSFGK
jgi:hypothetical protein